MPASRHLHSHSALQQTVHYTQSSFQRTPETQSAVPRTPVKETLALDQFTHTHTHTHTLTNTSAKRTAAGHDLSSAHAYVEHKHILFLSHNLWLFFISLSQRHRHLLNQAVNRSLLLKQSQDKGSLSESTLQYLYGASREHESINRRITLEMLVNSPHTP